MSWGAVLAVAGAQLRRHWLVLTSLGLLAGVAGAVVAGTVAVAVRTATAHERLELVTGVDDARVVLLSDAIDPVDVLALPEVASGWVTTAAVGRLVADAVTYASVATGPPPPAGLAQPVVLSGRLPDPGAADEVLVSEPMAERTGLGPGSALDLDLLTPGEVRALDVGFGERVRLHVTGVGRLPVWGDGLAHLVAGPAFAERNAEALAGTVLLLRLADGTTGDDLVAALDALAAAGTVTPGAEELGPYQLAFPATRDDARVEASERVLVGGLAVLAVVAAGAGTLAVLQALARHHSAHAAEQEVERALGMTAGERVLARVLAALPPAGVAALVAGAGALAAGGVEPLGALRRFEPRPGWAPDGFVAVDGALAVAAAVLVLTAVTAARAGAGAGRPRRGRPPRSLTGAVPGPELATAVSLVVRRARGEAALGPAAAGAALAVAGVVAAGTFAASLQRTASDPTRYGWHADLGVVDAVDPDVDALAADPRVAAVAVVEEGTLRLAGEPVPALSVTRTSGTLDWTLLEGRLPSAPGEVAVGPRVAHRLEVSVGDTVSVERSGPVGGSGPVEGSGPAAGAADAHRAGSDLLVVGEVLAPVLDRERLGSSVLVPAATLAQYDATQPLRTALVRATGDAALDELVDELSRRLEVQAAGPPAEVRDLTDLGHLPHLLAGFLALVGLLTWQHTVTVAARRRGRDLAVLSAVGFTPRQVAATLLAAAALTLVVGLAVGLPLGLAVGRLVWAEVAEAASLAGVTVVPAGPVTAVVAGTLAAGLLLTLAPAVRAASPRHEGLLRARPAVAPTDRAGRSPVPGQRPAPARASRHSRRTSSGDRSSLLR